MRSYQIVDWDTPLELAERETPAPQGTEVLLKVDACGVCHSDIHIRQGFFDLGDGEVIRLVDRGAKLPLTLGHETVGEVVALGPEAKGANVGDKRIVFPWIGCRQCAVCRSGMEMLCMTPRFIGARVDGGFSDYVVVPDAKYLVAYDGVPTDLACTYACSGITAYAALQKVAPLGADDSILIVGAGGVGLNGVYIARALFEARLIVADIDPAKRAAAKEAGADEVIDNAEKGALEHVIELSGGGTAASLDFVGAPATSKFGCDVLRKGGTHVVVGLYGGKLPVPLPLMPQKQLVVRGSYVGTLAEMHALMDLVRAGKVPPLPVHARPLDEAEQALTDLASGKVVGRYVLKP
jgi:propanol-preferring alcohol dehydrogenase